MAGDPAQLEIRSSPLGPYRLRGHTTTRLEAFSDAVFGFSATLLVVSLEVPRTFADLIADLKGFGAFGISVSILLSASGAGRLLGGIGGWIYALLGPIMGGYWALRTKRRDRLEAALAA